MKNDRVYLEYILERIQRIEEDVADGRDSFMGSHTIQDAVLRNLQTLAESCQRLSEQFKQRYPEVEWSKINAFRNVLVHDYLGIDLSQIWLVIMRDVPELKTNIKRSLNMLPE